MPGRLYGRGPCAQKLTRRVRAVAFHNLALDLDINICHPCTLLNKSLEICSQRRCRSTFPILCTYAKHYKVWKSFLQARGDMDAKAAQKDFNRLLYFGRPTYDLPFMRALLHEMRFAVQGVLDSDEFEYLWGMFEERRNPFATRLFCALSKHKRMVVDQMAVGIKGALRDVRINVCMFDWCIVSHNNFPGLRLMPPTPLCVV